MRPKSPDVWQGYIPFGPEIRYCDAIEFMGELWLVTNWSESQAEGWSKPTRIIALASLGEVTVTGQTFVVNGQVPKSLLYDPIPPEVRAQFRVIDRPAITFPYLPGLN